MTGALKVKPVKHLPLVAFSPLLGLFYDALRGTPESRRGPGLDFRGRNEETLAAGRVMMLGRCRGKEEEELGSRGFTPPGLSASCSVGGVGAAAPDLPPDPLTATKGGREQSLRGSPHRVISSSFPPEAHLEVQVPSKATLIGR